MYSGFGGTEYNLVVHGAAIKGMRMAHKGKLARVPRGIPFKQRFNVSRRSGDDETFDLRGNLRKTLASMFYSSETVTLGIEGGVCQLGACCKAA